MSKKPTKLTDKMAQKYKTVEDLQEYANAQFKQIITLSKELTSLKEENAGMKMKLQDAENIKKLMNGPVDTVSPFDVTDEETICILQLKFLKDNAISRELTMEECKKVEIYIKSLNVIRNRIEEDPEDENIKSMGTDDLVKAMEDALKNGKQ